MTEMQQQQQKPKCLGHLKKDCDGKCGFYQECLEIHMGVSQKLEVRD